MCIDVWSCALPRVDDGRRVHSISLQIYVLFLFLQSFRPVFFIIIASNVQIVFAKSISKSVEDAAPSIMENRARKGRILYAMM